MLTAQQLSCCRLLGNRSIIRAAVYSGIPMVIPIGMGMGWVWGVINFHGFMGILWGFSNRCDVRFSRNAWGKFKFNLIF